MSVKVVVNGDRSSIQSDIDYYIKLTLTNTSDLNTMKKEFFNIFKEEDKARKESYLSDIEGYVSPIKEYSMIEESAIDESLVEKEDVIDWFNEDSEDIQYVPHGIFLDDVEEKVFDTKKVKVAEKVSDFIGEVVEEVVDDVKEEILDDTEYVTRGVDFDSIDGVDPRNFIDVSEEDKEIIEDIEDFSENTVEEVSDDTLNEEDVWDSEEDDWGSDDDWVFEDDNATPEGISDEDLEEWGTDEVDGEVEEELSFEDSKEFKEEIEVSAIKEVEDLSIEKTMIEDVPSDLRSFVKKHPNCEISFALKYFSQKEIDKQQKLGRVYKKKGKLFI